MQRLWHTFLQHNFFPIHSSFLTYKGHMRDTPSQKILVSEIDLQLYQALLDSTGGIFRTQSSFYNELISLKLLTAYSY